jgi:iron(III) transport system permease protein
MQVNDTPRSAALSVDPATGTTTRTTSRWIGFNWTLLLWIALAVILAFIVVNPILRLIVVSFEDPDSGAFTLANYITAYGRARHIEALLNTVMMGGAVAVLCTIFAVPLAWACSRTDMPGRTFVRLTVLGAFITPPYLGAVGWILLAGPNSGWLNKIWMSLTGSEQGIVDVFSFYGLVLIMAINLYFFIFVFVSAALDMVSSEMEDAANILGAGTLRTAAKVTMPLVLPALIGGLIVTFLQAIALFGVPALISIPARFPVVATQLWQFFEFPVQVEVAAAYAIPLLGITVTLFLLQKLLLSRKGFVAVTGKGGERRLVKLGKFRWVMFGYAMFVAAISVFLPVFVLGQAAFSKAWARGFALDNLTLANFRYILFEHNTSQQALVQSFSYAASAAFVAIALSLLIAYIVRRRLLPGAGALAFVSMMPFVIPGVVLAIGFYAAYTAPPFSLYGTGLILVLAFTTRFLPIAYANSDAGIRSINPEMEDAVRILGGGRLTAIRRVVAPLLKKTLAGGWILVFVPAVQELSTAVFLAGPETRIVSVLLLDLSEEGNLEHLSALGSVLLVLIVAIVAIGFKLIGRDFMLRRSS